MKFEGQVVHIGDYTKISDKFAKQEVVIKTIDDQYPQEVVFEMHNARADILQKVKIGQTVEVAFDIRGRRWDGQQGTRWFNTLVAWQLYIRDNEHGNTQMPSRKAIEEPVDNSPPPSEREPFETNNDDTVDGDLPF